MYDLLKGKRWFGEDGEILSLPDPVKEIPSRPIICEELDPSIQTFYRKVGMKSMGVLTILIAFRYLRCSLEQTLKIYGLKVYVLCMPSVATWYFVLSVWMIWLKCLRLSLKLLLYKLDIQEKFY